MAGKRALRSTKSAETEHSSVETSSDSECDGLVDNAKKVKMNLKMKESKNSKLQYKDKQLYHEDPSFDVLKLCVISLPKFNMGNLQIRIVKF